MSGTTRRLSVATCHVINIAFFGLMAMILVMFPHARTPPWGFAGWIGVILSILLWLSSGVFVAVLIGWLASEPDTPMAQMTGETMQGYAMVGGTFLVLTWLLAFCELDTEAPVSDFASVLAEASDHPVQSSIDQWKVKKADLERTRDRFIVDLRQLVQQLHEMGIYSKADIKEDPAGLELAKELKELISQGQSVTNEIERLESGVVRAESKLRRLERRKFLEEKGAVSEHELEDFSLLQHELEEGLRGSDGKLSPLGELALEAFIEEHFEQ